MKKESLLYSLGCALGGCMIGFFAGELDRASGALLFCFSIALLVFCTAKASKYAGKIPGKVKK